MRTLAVFSILALALSAPAFAVDKTAIIEHIRESYPSIPASVEMTLGDPKPSEVPGFDVLELDIRGQNEKLYLSKDGRYYVLGGFKDLKTSPDKERMSMMKLSGAPVRGNKEAKVQVVEYTDFQCPFCQIGFWVMRDDIMKKYGTKISWIYKSLPLKEIHPWAETAAIGAECVHKQGDKQFWAVHDAVFDAQKLITVRNIDDVLEGITKAQSFDTVFPDALQHLEQMPKSMGIPEDVKGYYGKMKNNYEHSLAELKKINADKFKTCYLSKDSAQSVDKDLGEAGNLGINGTPAFLINGRLISGADGDSIRQLIEAALKKSEKT